MRAPLGPGQPPYEGPYDIPVIVDDRPKRLGAFQMTRCTFFTIEATEAVDDWVAQLRVDNVPFLLLGLFAVVHRPDLEAARFTSPQQISSLFDKIEDTEGLVVESAAIWLPNLLVEEAAGERPPRGDDDDVTKRGDVFRVDFGLFQESLRFLNNVLSAERFTEQCMELRRRGPLVEWSPEEAETFQRWSHEHILEAKDNYERQRANPEQVVLEYRDEDGEVHAG